MKLARLGRKVWTVLAVLTEREECPVLDLLESSDIPGERLLADLRETIPARGPPRNSEASEYLRDKIFELREQVTRGGTLRVLYFYDDDHVVVCVNGVLKKKDKTPKTLIDAAVEKRTAYFDAKAKKQLAIVDLPP